jgi:hypothetical protein
MVGPAYIPDAAKQVSESRPHMNLEIFKIDTTSHAACLS